MTDRGEATTKVDLLRKRNTAEMIRIDAGVKAWHVEGHHQQCVAELTRTEGVD